MTATLIACLATLVIDGDTLECTPHGRIRLARVNSPELSELGGAEAKDWMRLKITGHRVVCVVSGRERYGRLLGECFTGTGTSLSDQLLNAGMARKYWGKRSPAPASLPRDRR